MTAGFTKNNFYRKREYEAQFYGDYSIRRDKRRDPRR